MTRAAISACSAARCWRCAGSRSRRISRCRPTSTTCWAAPSSLRGFDTGYKADDNLAAASAELRIPLTSPLSIGRFGVKIFADYGAAYPNGQKLADQTFDLGIGGGAYLHLTLISLGLDVAKGRGGDWHFQFGMGVTFK